jgi:tetratricopeptide (TPR) repeat protein
MEANTFPDPRVSRFINEHTVPVQFNVKDDPGAWARYHSFWTPTVILRDVDDAEYRRSVGPLNSDQFLAEFSLGYALRFFNSGQFEKSIQELESSLEYTHAWPSRHAENLYMLAAARYEASGKDEDLMSTWEELRSKYPDSSWACKSRQLKLD